MNNKPIRILHVLGGLNLGGAETMIMNYYRNIDKNKIQFDFIIHSNHKQFYEDEILSMGGKIYRFPKYRIVNHFKYKKAWKKFFNKHPEYKIIHGHMRSTAVIYLKIALDFKLLTISHSHSTDNGKGIISLIKNIYCKNIIKYSNYCFACSDEAAVWLFGNNILSSNKYLQLKNAIDLDKYKYNEGIRKSVKKKLGVENDFVIGHIGRFCYQKNHKFLVAILQKMINFGYKNIKLLLIGNGELKKSIIEQCELLNIRENVIFLENRTDVNELLQAMDVFCFPSFHEGLGIVSIESQASGLPTIVSNNVPSSVLLTNNILQLPLEEELWIEEIVRIMNNKMKRKDNCLLLKTHGYDIKTESCKLENYYISLSENNR